MGKKRKDPRVKEEAVAQIVTLLTRHAAVKRALSEYIAERIFRDIIEPAVIEERDEWCYFIRSDRAGGFDA